MAAAVAGGIDFMAALERFDEQIDELFYFLCAGTISSLRNVVRGIRLARFTKT